jgi:hypothetical protein
MSTSKTKTNSPLQSTRQMLDELDSLMERMLALPVGDVDDLPPPRDVPVAPTVKAKLTPISDLTDDTTADDEAADAEDDKFLLERVDNLLTDTEPPPVTAEAPPVSPRLDEGSSQLAPRHEFLTHSARSTVPRFRRASEEFPERLTKHEKSPTSEVLSFLESPAAPSVTRPPVEAAREPAPVGRVGQLPLLPLLWVNQIFDGSTMLLGPMGRGLRCERGHNFLGLLGLACLGLAGAWFVFDQFAGR